MKWVIQILLLLLPAGVCLAGGVKSSAVVDPFSEWSVCSFSAPGEALAKVFPVAPSVGASKEAIQASIEKSSRAGLRFFDAKSIQLPPGTLMLASPERDQLTVMTTVAAQSRVKQFMEDVWLPQPTVLTCKVEAVEADAGFFQDNIDEVDHSRIQAALQDQMKAGKARVIAAVELTTPSGKRVAIEPAAVVAARGLWLRCAIEPILGDDGDTVDLSLSVGLDPVGTEFTAETLVLLGRACLVGHWPASNGKCIAILVTVRVEASFAVPDTLLETWLVKEGESVAVAPPTVAVGMAIRRFKVPPDILSLGAAMPSARLSGEAFRQSMKQILIDQGISFPAGSDACFLSDSQEMVVKNSPQNLDLVEAWVSSIIWDPPFFVGLRLSVIETSAAALRRLERDASPVTGQRQLWEALVKQVTMGEGRWVSCVWLEVLSGRKGTVATGNQDPDSGLSWTVGPVVGADGGRVDLDSVLRVGGRRGNGLKSSLTTLAGSPQLLTIWASPGGHGDTLQAVFVESRIVGNLGRK